MTEAHGIDRPLQRLPPHTVRRSWHEILATRKTVRSYDANRVATAEVDHLRRRQKNHSRIESDNFSSVQAVHAHGLYNWSKTNSWMFCDNCWSLVACSLNPLRMRSYAPNVLPFCGSCDGYVVPKLANIPRELRKLHADTVRALRPFDVDVGNAPARHASGFRRHGGILTLSWSVDPVTDKIERLPPSQKEADQDAYLFLMSSRRSAYRKFVSQHEEFLVTGGDRKQSLNILQTRYIECALWPDLYPFKKWCDSFWDGSHEKYASAKASYISKLLSSVVDYGVLHDLLHFQFDKWVFSRFTQRCSVAQHYGADLKYFLRDVGETPYAMHIAHLKLIDLHRTLGAASFWYTVAQGLWSTPWHSWVEDSLCKSASALGSVGINENLHLLHVLRELIERYIATPSSTSFRCSPMWIPLMDQSCVVACATRLEFQEGSRNESRPYHGTGLPHVHILIWADSRLTETNLCSCLRADFGAGVLKEAVQRQQRSTSTKLHVNPENTVWDYVDDKWKLRVKHPQDAADACVQPYLEAVCRAHIGHQCFLSVSSPEHVIEYSTRWTK